MWIFIKANKWCCTISNMTLLLVWCVELWNTVITSENLLKSEIQPEYKTQPLKNGLQVVKEFSYIIALLDFVEAENAGTNI